jgi:hypothetical protein
MVLTTVFAAFVFYMTLVVYEKMGCGIQKSISATAFHGINPICIWHGKLITFVAENNVTLVKLIYGEVIAGLGLVFAYMTSFV